MSEMPRARSDPLPSNSDPLPSAARRRAPAAPARHASEPLDSNAGEAAPECVGAGERRERSPASGPVLASIVDPERLKKGAATGMPVLVSAKTSKDGKEWLCMHQVRTGGAQGSTVASLCLGALAVSRFWGCPQSKQRMLELTVPGDEQRAGSVLLSVGDYDAMSRLAHMMGRDHFD